MSTGARIRLKTVVVLHIRLTEQVFTRQEPCQMLELELRDGSVSVAFYVGDVDCTISE